MPKFILLFLSLFLFLTSACQETNQSKQAQKKKTPANVSTTKVNTNNNLAQPTPKELTFGHLDPSHDFIMNNLTEAIYNWSPEPEFALNTELKNIWVKGGNRPWEYSTKGAKRLINRIQTNSFFSTCQQAKQLTPKMFEPDGEIQTVGKLYDELYFCNSDN